MKLKHQEDYILVVDFGGQYTQLIARKIRELGVFSEIAAFNDVCNALSGRTPSGIILSGGPNSIYSEDSPRIGGEIFNREIPVLGICYGMQLIAHIFGGKIRKSGIREYGRKSVEFYDSPLFSGLPQSSVCWMSHQDTIEKVPDGYRIIASTPTCSIAAIQKDNIFGVQFHPEVSHTEFGREILISFLKNICKVPLNYNPKNFITNTIEEIREKVGNAGVVLGLSGGVDSSVSAILLHRAIGSRLYPIFVNNGLLRHKEEELVQSFFREKMGMNLIYSNASDVFLQRLKSVTDPNQKRVIIGNTFIEIFEKEALRLPDIEFLAQGTLYPDVIESISVKGPSSVIKLHHNVGGLPEKMNLKIIEPLRMLFKDEVRKIGLELGLPQEIIERQPFPGPGLAVRILGEVTKDKVLKLQEADRIVIQEIKKAGLYNKIWQSFAILLPLKTVGVMGDAGTYQNVLAIRAVSSEDAMTADWVKLPYDVLENISGRITGEVDGINRVVYDITSKPPGTIEWE